MADDQDDPPVPMPLHPRDLAALQRRQDERLDELVAAVRRAPVADDPQLRGVDIRALQATMQAILDARTAPFLTREQIDAMDRVVEQRAGERVAQAVERVDQRITGNLERLASVGIRLDDAHIEETGEAIRGAMKWHRLASRTWMTAVGTIFLGLVYAALRKAGFSVPSAG